MGAVIGVREADVKREMIAAIGFHARAAEMIEALGRLEVTLGEFGAELA